LKPVYFGTLFILFYTWIGYLLLLLIVDRFKEIKISKEAIFPFITILIPIYNEEEVIKRKITNLLESDYPADRLELLIVSDGSTDNSEQIVAEMGRTDPRLRLFKTPRAGKSGAQNRALPLARGEIVVLTDAGTVFEKDALKNLVSNFADGRVGCVTGRLNLLKDCTSISESQGLYWKFEILLRKLESRIGTLHTCSGALMALQKSLFVPFADRYGDDCIIPLDVLSQGYRIVQEDDAVAYDTMPSTMGGELRARVRMTLRNITCTLSRYSLFNPFKYGLISISVLSHKILRWLTPYFLIILFSSNLFLINAGAFYLLTFGLQLLFYGLGTLGYLAERQNRRIPVGSQIFSFLLANLGFFLGVLKAIKGQAITAYKT
jgi:cellulose synthase/poly-beta-1,6-N-acetylglucosamine synthase-like glycosyltransferase